MPRNTLRLNIANSQSRDHLKKRSQAEVKCSSPSSSCHASVRSTPAERSLYPTHLHNTETSPYVVYLTTHRCCELSSQPHAPPTLPFSLPILFRPTPSCGNGSGGGCSLFLGWDPIHQFSTKISIVCVEWEVPYCREEPFRNKFPCSERHCKMVARQHYHPSDNVF